MVEVGGRTISLIGGDTYLAGVQRTFNWGKTKDYQYADSRSEQWGDDKSVRHGDSVDHHFGISSSMHLGMTNEMFIGMKTSLSIGPVFELTAAGGITIDLGALKFTYEGSIFTAKVSHSPLSVEWDNGVKTKKGTLSAIKKEVEAEKAEVKMRKAEIVALFDAISTIKTDLHFHKSAIITIAPKLACLL